MISRILLELQKEINLDPNNIGYSEMIDIQIITALNDLYIEQNVVYWITDRTLDFLFGIEKSLEIIGKLTVLADTPNPLAERVLDLLCDRAGAGIDVSKQISKDTIGLFVTVGILTQEECDAIINLGIKKISRFQELGFETPVDLDMLNYIKG